MAKKTQKFEGNIQEIMLGSLWAQATYSKLYPSPVFVDFHSKGTKVALSEPLI